MAIVVEDVETLYGARYQIERQDRTGEILAVICVCRNCGRKWADGEEGIALLADGWVPWLCKCCTEELKIKR